jgi:glucose-1-phosphate cytidylyltransferase
MQVVILAGGFGTRLREETEHRPKPMVEIGERPIVWHIMKHYSVFDVQDFVICLGYKGEIIRNYFMNYKLMDTDISVELGTGLITQLAPSHDEEDWKVVLADTGLHTQTAGRLLQVRKYIDDDVFLVTYGDSLSDVPIDAVIAQHKKMGKIGTVCAMQSMQRFGVLSFSDNIATGFEEKPKGSGDWINGGFYVFDRKIFDYIDEDCMLEQGPISRLVQDRQLAVYRHTGCHRAMDNMKDWELLTDEWNSGNPCWKIW